MLIQIHQYGDLVYLMVKYLTETGEVSDKKKVIDLLTHALPQGEKEMTTLAQDWMNEGYQKGIHAGMEKGMERGIEKGEHEKALAIAKNMLKDGFDQDTISRITGLVDLGRLKATNHKQAK